MSDQETYQRDFNAAADLIALFGHSRGCEARDATGKPVPFDDPKACEFCLMGAIYRITGSRNGRAGVMIDFLRRYMLKKKHIYMTGHFVSEASDKMPRDVAVRTLRGAANAWGKL